MRRELRRHPIEPPTTSVVLHEGELAFARPSDPVFSIVIPVFNHVAVTLECMRSVASAAASEAFEVILVDDASTDADVDELRQVPGAIYLRNPANHGFVATCNAGAAVARGRILVFLNSDTLVTPDWLKRIGETLSQPGVGLVGTLLQYPDGTLQEAGGIVFSDGSGWNYGRGGNPADPRYRYRRDTDYCSGAALAISRERFRSLGGFDAHYAPGYYEDTDLAMKVRSAGDRVVYEPSVAIVHLEGVSAGKELSTGMKAFQVTNAIKFQQRWARELQHAHAPTGTDPDLAARLSPVTRAVAVCGHAGAARLPGFYELLESLVQQHIAVDLHFLEAPEETWLCRLRSGGICCWTPDWRETALWVLLKTGAEVGVVLGDGSAASEAWIRKITPDVPNAVKLRHGIAEEGAMGFPVVTPGDVVEALTGSRGRVQGRQ